MNYTFILANCCNVLIFLFLEWKCFNISSTMWGSCNNGLDLSHKAWTTRGLHFIAYSIVSNEGSLPILPAWASKINWEMHVTISWIRNGHFLVTNNLKITWTNLLSCEWLNWFYCYYIKTSYWTIYQQQYLPILM